MNNLESGKEWKKRGRNKRNGAKNTKKKSLLSFWLGIWVPLFLIVMLAIGAGTGIAYSNVVVELSEGFGFKVEEIIMDIDWEHGTDEVGKAYQKELKKGKENAEEFVVYALEARINSLWKNTVYGVLYDEKGNIITATNKSVYMGYGTKKDQNEEEGVERTWYKCGDKEIVEKICQVRGKYKQSAMDAFGVKFDDVYIKGRTFLPGKMVILKDNMPIETVSFSLENKELSDYDHMEDILKENKDGTIEEESQDKMYVAVYGYEDSELECFWDEEYLETLKNVEFLGEDETYYYGYEQPSFNELDVQSYQKITVGEKDYYVRLGRMYQPFTLIKEDVFAAIGIGTIFTMLFALAVAANFHRIYKKERMLQERQRDFSNALAHDLKTPMMVISGYAENLAEQTHPEKQAHYIAGIQSNISYMNELVGQILELAKIDHEMELRKEQINLRGLVEKVVTMHEKMAEEKQMEVQVTGEANVYADGGYMERVLANLLKNALEFSPEHQSVFIKLSQTNVEITNTGVEISREKLEDMWKPFVKGDKSRSRESGHGLGLAIVKQILDMHGFGYEMTSENGAVTVKIFI